MVHQHFMLVDTFTVLENLVLGAEGGPLLAGGLAKARAELARLAREYGMSVNPDAKIADLSVGEQQRAEILKVPFRGARILQLDKSSTQSGEVLLEAEHLSLVDFRGVRLLDDVDLQLRAGEIVGIAGVTGNGQTELLQVLSGIRRPTGGKLTVRGRVIDVANPCDPAEMRDLGLAHVPED